MRTALTLWLLLIFFSTTNSLFGDDLLPPDVSIQDAIDSCIDARLTKRFGCGSASGGG